MARLGDVFALQITGEWGMECQDGDIGIPVLRTTNFTSIGEIDYTKIAHRSIAISKVQKKKLLTGDIILEKSGGTDNIPVGRVVFCDSRIQEATYLCNNFTQAMRPDLSVVCPKYLFYVMWNLHQSGATDLMQNKTTGIRNLQVLRYLDTKIPLPPLDEQKGIADTLDRISDLLANRKQQLAKLDELVKSRFIEMFGDFKFNSMGWPVMAFDEIAIIDGNMTTDYKKCADFPHVGIDSIEKYTGALKGYRTVSEDGVISGKYMFTPDHIIYSKIRPNLNKVALPDFSGVCSADAYPILPIKEKCNRIFLAYNMRSKFFLDYILQYCSRTNLPKVNRKEVAGFETPLPPLALQTQFAAFVAQVDKSKFGVQRYMRKVCKGCKP